jgi:hypothetical protein
VQNDRTNPNNQTDIVLKDNEIRTCLLIDSATAGDGKSIKKDDEILKNLKLKYSLCETYTQKCCQ